MSKIRQAVRYERQIAKKEVKAHRELVQQGLDSERKLTDSEVAGQVRSRNEALAYERKITDAQFRTLAVLNDEHRTFHEREHLLYEAAVEKASASTAADLSIVRKDIEGLELASHTYMSTVRFEREHSALLERVEEMFARVDEKLAAQEKITLQQTTQQSTREEMLATLATNRRWLTGLAVSLGVTMVVTILNYLKIL
jgi:hypothetical protein